jgi:hypothetical protein
MKAPASPEPRPQRPALVGRQGVPDHHHGATPVPEQVAQKVDNLLLGDRSVPMKLKIPSQPATARRDREPPDGRDAPRVAGPVSQDRRLATRRPGAANPRLHEKAGFIDENKVSVMPGHIPLDPRSVLFDPAAEGVLVTFKGPTFGFLRGKNRGVPSGTESRTRDMTRRSGRQSAGQSADRSTGRWLSRRRRPLSEARRRGRAAAGRSVWDAAPGGVEPPRLRGLPSAPAAPRGRRSAAWCPADGLSRSGRTRASAAPRPVAAAAPTARGFLGVSCFILSASGPNED